MPATQGAGLNCFAFLTRDNQCRYTTTREHITGQFIFEQMEHVSMQLEKLTVVVLDNAQVHVASLIQARRAVWEKRGLYLFYLRCLYGQVSLSRSWHEFKNQLFKIPLSLRKICPGT